MSSRKLKNPKKDGSKKEVDFFFRGVRLLGGKRSSVALTESAFKTNQWTYTVAHPDSMRVVVEGKVTLTHQIKKKKNLLQSVHFHFGVKRLPVVAH